MPKAVQFSLNKPQQVVWNSPARFKVVVAGRRMGKSTLAVMGMIAAALSTTNHYGDPLTSNSQVVYFGTDREQAKRNVWAMLKDFARPWTVRTRENSCCLTIHNGDHEVQMRLLGMDDPDKARGMAIRHVVLDEYADMPESAWDEVIYPALMDSRGTALFIGTPKGRTHFYHLYAAALSGELGEDWEAFSFTSADNETINPEELKKMAETYARGSPELYEQEIQGKFINKGGQLFDREDFIIGVEPPKTGSTFITVDLAGFTKEAGKRRKDVRRLDETAICVNTAYPTEIDGKQEVAWYVRDIIHGKWDVEETANQIVIAYMKYHPVALGIEKGALMRAVEPYLQSVQRHHNLWMNIRPLTHGNQQKYDRIQWALQGRAKRGLITLHKADWNGPLIEQATDFPSRIAHDDLLDALAYQDQLADWVELEQVLHQPHWQPTDSIAGY